ncbi:polysaccharide export protein [Qipengyuania sp. 6B39]|uniref:polysaccharide biosynthesis/export family protein n=1 Tax=Qipengyuania proteolytica TaxID=2867239 RepID=UPI001C893DA9|nr:polysaccharide biosynthesis/export family protein [Qipengyuania proteolytica]MBX7496418.1 polysaccharide export protein [Qipengyuania proteolytica]
MATGFLVLGTIALSGCFSPSSDLPKGGDAYRLMPPADIERGPAQYRIGVLDVLSVRVFQEPELTFDQIAVDAAGRINFPFIGEVDASGKTPVELSDEIEYRLGQSYIRNPQVVVGVVTSAGQRVTVDGQVNQPGVYEVAGSSSLIEAVARAQGTTETAVEDEVVVFRQIDGERYGAIFDLRAIREGRVPDPEILGGDRIVVGFSATRGLYRDFLRAAPLLNVFTRF